MHVINFNFQFSINCLEKFSKKFDSTPLFKKNFYGPVNVYMLLFAIKIYCVCFIKKKFISKHKKF